MRLIDWEQSAMNTLLEIPVSIDYDLGDRGEISVMGVWLIKEGLDEIETFAAILVTHGPILQMR